ncbi:MAG: 3-oxoacyl-[acyl-carrier-protein] reductase [Saccharofermentanales bacterium]
MLKGKTAVVTGGSRGIGAEIANKLAQNGADIALLYAGNDEAASKVVSAISRSGNKCVAYKCDVSDFNSSRNTVERIITDFGEIDILVNNAGIVRDGFVLSMQEEDFDDVIAVNLKGSFNMIKHVYRHMMKRRTGRIINISSVVGLSGNAGQSNYAASKAGLIGLTKSTAKELAGRGITCNAVAPGYIETDMTASLSEGVKAGYISSIPMRRAGNGSEVADAVLFLASNMADYITGEVIKVDGGLSM